MEVKNTLKQANNGDVYLDLVVRSTVMIVFPPLRHVVALIVRQACMCRYQNTTPKYVVS